MDCRDIIGYRHFSNTEIKIGLSYKTIILGAGESGIGAALLAKAKGMEPFVSDMQVISDERKAELEQASIPYEEGQHSEEIILQGEEIIKSPGIPDSVSLIVKAKEKGIPIINELEFAFRFTNAKMVAITGTNGKTTTALLTYHLLKEGGVNVGLAGNVGFSLAKQVIEDKHECYVVEVSSFQLDGMYDFKADLGVLLNITPDHLDRYDNDFQQYVSSKFRLLQNMTAEDHLIYWDDDPSIEQRISTIDSGPQSHPISIHNQLDGGAFISGKQMVVEGMEIELEHIPLIGKHNLINSMAAIQASKIMGLSKDEITKGLRTFHNAPHRLEKVATLHEVDFINDSKATNVNAVYYALEGIESKIIWIAGGVDKGNDYRLIDQLVQQKVKAMICLGKKNEPLTSFFEGKIASINETEDIAEAVRTAMALANAGDVVLMSPACASFDLFNNYMHRGDRFREEVLKLKSRNGHREETIA